MNYIELFINEPSTTSLDINQEVDIALQYSIADIKDISKRNAAYSKTIILPGTKNNNYWFGNLFDVNADFTMFNPNKKIAAKLLVNTEIVIDGFLQLRKIVKLNNADQQGNMINYEIVIFNNAVDLMQELGEKTINSLDLSQFGHTFSNTEVKNSWTHTYQDGYVYPMLGTHTKDNLYKVEYFYPAIFYRTLLDQMVREAGFGWTGSLLTNDQFNHEVLAYVTDGRPKIDEDERRRRQFYVGLTPSTLEVNMGIYPNTFGYQSLPIGGGGPHYYGYTMSFNNENDPYYDNDNNWDTSLHIWNIDRNGEYSAQYSISYDLNLRNSSSTTTMAIDTIINQNPQVKAVHALEYSINGGTTWTTWDSSTQYITYTQATIAPGSSASKHVYVARQAPTINLPIGAKVRLRWKGWQWGQGWWAGTGGNATPTMTARVVFKDLDTGNWLKNEAYTADFTQNDYIDLAAYLPDKIKQKDLLGDLIKRYNLYIQTDPNNPKMLIFDTRPDFYNRGITVDWTHKKDFSSADEIELLSDLQYKLMIWSYKADSDLYNKEYLDVTGDVYGQYKYFFDNDFVKGEERIESQFSPTPLVKTPFNAIVPGINPEQPKVQPRIFYWGGLKDCSDGWQWTYQSAITGATGSTESFTKYPYAGHFDDPINPTIDINFGESKYYFYNDWTSLPASNMFNTYWSDYIRQIETGKLVTSYFNLDEYDIRFIKDNFYTKIFIVDSYYYVNKIIDYKPLNNGLTKVELIKIIDGVTWKPKVSTRPITFRPDKPINQFVDLAVGFNNTGTGVVIGSNNVSGGKVQVGSFSTLNRSLVVGDNNVLVGDAGLVVGSNNNVSTDFSTVLSGSGNVITEPNIVLIAANNVTATQSNTVYIGNSYVVNTETGAVTIGTSSTPWSPPSYYIEDTTIPAAKVQIINDNFVTLTSLWRGASGSEYIKNEVMDGSTGAGSSVFIQSSSLSLESNDGSSNSSRLLSMPNYMSSVVYDNASLTAVSTLVLENISSDGELTLDTVASVVNTRQDTIKLSPGGDSFIKSYDTVVGDETMIAFYPTGVDTTVSAGGVIGAAYISNTSIQLQITDGTLFNNNISLNSGVSPGIQLTTSYPSTSNFSEIALRDYQINQSVTDGSSTTTIIQSTSSVVISVAGATAATFNSGGDVKVFNDLEVVDQVKVGYGTRTAPSFTFTSDSDTGLYHNTTNQMTMVAGGATAAIVSSTGILPTKLYLKSPDGTTWEASISNSGVLTWSAFA